MNPDVFFENFEMLAEAQNGVQKLRELILQLAVRGKLVEQDPNDETASFLLERIKDERKKKIKISETLLPIEKNEIPFEIPVKWALCRLGEIIKISSGDALPSHKMDMDGKIPVYGGNGITGYHSQNNVTKPSIVIGRVGYYCGSVHITPNLAWITDNAFNTYFSESNIDFNFLYWLLKSANLGERNNSTAQPVISGKKVYPIVVAIPPLAEQKRIVTKVDELMALCDQLEARQQKKKELRSKLNSAALDKMLSAENQDEFEENWRRICENFDLLYDNPESVEELRKAVLQLAVQGKLVEQDERDELASVLIEKIQVEKKRLVREKKIKQTKQLPDICSDELPYDIPENWNWIRLGDIASSLRYGTSKKCTYEPSGVPVLRIPNLINGKINTDDLKYTHLTEKEREDLKLELGDLLLIRSNGSTSLVGRSAVIDGGLADYAYAGYLVRLRTFPDEVFSDYLHIALDSRYVRDQIELPIRTTSGVKNINSTEISKLIIPLPPLNEQKRIVEKVEQLMGLCDELERKLRKGREDSEKLMKTVVWGLLEGAAGEI